MILPPRTSRQMAIIDTLRGHGAPLSLAEGIALHGLPRRVTLAEMAELYEELVVMGCLARVGLRYTLSDGLLAHYAPPPAKVLGPAGEPVPSRTRPPFRPLSARFMVSARGLREGSNDWREAPSSYAQLAKLD